MKRLSVAVDAKGDRKYPTVLGTRTTRGDVMGGKTITRADLCEAVYQKVGLSRTESADLVEMVLDEISDCLVKGESVKLSSFGSFLVRSKGERIGRNPKTGEEVPISPRRVMVFKPSNSSRDDCAGAGGRVWLHDDLSWAIISAGNLLPLTVIRKIRTCDKRGLASEARCGDDAHAANAGNGWAVSMSIAIACTAAAEAVGRNMRAGPTISEVAADLDLPQHVLRFWETRFSQIKPLKRGGGRRYYRPDDVDLLKGIRHLLYGEGYTIRGVQRILKEQGIRFVMTLWQDGGPSLQGMRPDGADDREADTAPEETIDDAWDQADVEASQDLPQVPLRLTRGEDRSSAILRQATTGTPQTGISQTGVMARGQVPQLGETDELSPESMAQRFAPRISGQSPTGPAAAVLRSSPIVAPEATYEPAAEIAAPVRPLQPKELSAARGPAHAGDVSAQADAGSAGLSRDEVRRLQATLFELLECKRLLDQAR
eukprot:gene22163-23226_t